MAFIFTGNINLSRHSYSNTSPTAIPFASVVQHIHWGSYYWADRGLVGSHNVTLLSWRRGKSIASPRQLTNSRYRTLGLLQHPFPHPLCPHVHQRSHGIGAARLHLPNFHLQAINMRRPRQTVLRRRMQPLQNRNNLVLHRLRLLPPRLWGTRYTTYPFLS